ncbi:general substrate transporter [Vararia minispora EC-137]|uniref:General substrate transporter n=1 Tax=Vararia minispora EC-137 TaxID=1314806 RepID=A0ACB8QWJ3_9AGAM|nr:general substrate transporter [Vararia minispora EC-137]
MSFSWLKPKSYSAGYPRCMVGKPLLIATSALASLGDAMFGYSAGVIASNQVQPSFIARMFHKNVTIEQIQAGDTGVDPYLVAIMVSCLNITALLSSFAAAYICDVMGRRMSVRIGAAIYLVSAFIQIFTPSLGVLIFGRSLQGIAVGILSMTVPILQCEIAPGAERGLFVAIEYTCLNVGYALSAWVGYAFYFAMPSEIAWRGPYIVQAALAALLLAWTFWLPETPRWLIKNGFVHEGLTTLADLHAGGDPTNPAVLANFREIEETIEREDALGQATWGELFKQYPRRALVGITCQLFAQFNGINAILYYLPENLNRAGFSVSRALLFAGICAIVYCSGTVPTMAWIDRLGRRKFLLVGSVGLALALAVVGGLQFFADSLPIDSSKLPGAAGGIFAAVCLYLFVFGATWGPTPWLLGAEIFPLRARAKGMALSTVSNWLCNFIIAFITPPLFAVLRGGYYFVLLGFCLLSGVVVYIFYPETAHLTLEQLGSAFGDDPAPMIHSEGSFASEETMRGTDEEKNLASSEHVEVADRQHAATNITARNNTVELDSVYSGTIGA